MNRFRNKKKGKEETGVPRSSHDEAPTGGFRFRKAKKAQEEPKPEIDIASALPPTDDFRTSLLMTGLSARFSMLREQDDPSTKIGKASDDSVLFGGKRQSRMTDFSAFRDLGDIAEVASLRAPYARNESYNNSDADSMHGSVMSRSKPVEGNNLFGGRQKIYKIPSGANSAKNLGGMGGRVLYDDDVALSAFQKWKLAERERESFEENCGDASRRPSNEEREAGSEAQFYDTYNRKRETSSTTSSVPSMARNSTAATSIASQHPTPSVKDKHASTASTSTTSTPADRGQTRTRRLYETGLNQDLQEQQSSALSRIDTLARRGTRGSRTPDLSQYSPSSTPMGFVDRFSERRVLTKASAPNLRSMSPSVTASPHFTPDLGIRVPSTSEARSPLSSPIGEAEEVETHFTQPEDRGKATALGVFQKPAQPYDESRYAERMVQLQQWRETPTQAFRGAEVSPVEPKAPSPLAGPESSMHGDMTSPTFLASDAEESPVIPSFPMAGAQQAQRPSDRDHPALRSHVLTKAPVQDESSGAKLDSAAMVDSPTLGGLSGMVRQHLRADSGASSVNDGSHTRAGGYDSRQPVDSEDHAAPERARRDSNPWPAQNSTLDYETFDDGQGATEHLRAVHTNSAEEPDEFAHQLADGARRVRERLTTYVPDSRPTSPLPLHENKDLLNSPPTSRASPGLFRSKSRGPTAEQGKGVAPHSMKGLGLGISTEEPEIEMEGENKDGGEPGSGYFTIRQARLELQRLQEAEDRQRQGRATRGPPSGPPPGVPASRSTSAGRTRQQRTPSRDRGSAPFFAPNRRPSEEPQPGPRAGSRAGSRAESRANSRAGFRADSRPSSRGPSRVERDASGSESGGERPQSRPPPRTVRNGSAASDGAPPRPKRVPGQPGSDARRSPYAPQGHSSASPRLTMANYGPSGSLQSSGSESGPSSPMPTPLPLPSPLRPPMVPAPGVNSDGSSVPGLTAEMKRSVSKQQISSPTFVMSTSDVPTVALPPEAAMNRSRSDSGSRRDSKSEAFAPPLPPINPRRRTESRTRTTMFGLGRKESTDEGPSSSAPSLLMNRRNTHGPEADGRNASTTSEEEARPRPTRTRVQQMASQFQGRNSRSPGPANNSNSAYSVGPPASRMVVTQMNKLPGGMI